MDGSVDTSKRKPRRLRGTPAYKFLNRNSLIVLGISTLIGIGISFTDFHRRSIAVIIKPQTPEEIQRKENFQFIEQKSSSELRKLLQKQEESKYEDSSR